MIDDYIRDTRLISQHSINDFMLGMYIPIVVACEDFCTRMLQKLPMSPEIAITYSAQRKCELVQLGNNRILVYDRNLGQTLNTFNRILFFGKHSTDAYRPLLRLLTDEAILLGRSDIAAFLMTKCVKFRNTWSLPPAASDPFVQTQTWLQELFIIAHEYCHLLMAYDPEFHRNKTAVGHTIWHPNEGESDLEAIRQGMLSRYGEEYTAEQIIELQSYVKNTVKASEVDLVEELGCDDFAIHTLAEYTASVKIPPIDIFKATFLVLRHVRAINYGRAFVRQLAEKTEPSGIDRRTALLQARQHQMRAAFAVILAMIKQTHPNKDLQELTAKEAQSDIAELSDLHDKKIDEVLLFELIPNLENEFRDWRRRHKRNAEHDIGQCRLLANQRRWTYQPDGPSCYVLPPRT